MPLFTDLSYLVPELMLAVGAMALLILGVFLGDKSSRLISTAAIGLLVATLLVVAAMSGWPEREVFGGAFRIDAFSTFVKLFVLAAAALAILM